MASKRKAGIFLLMFLVYKFKANAQTDTLRVLAYNVLYLGDNPPCQGPHDVYEGYLETIVAYTNPDIMGLEKMAAIPMYPGDMSGSAPAGYADSLLHFSFNAAFPGRYAYCPYSNTSAADNISVLFYDQQKLGFAGLLCSYEDITDFNTYKLYYRSADLAVTHDTVFLYITLNHDNSGSGSSDAAIRGTQISGEMAQIETYFTQLPNMINMGDFNTHNSSEACYQTLVAPTNPGYKYYDPPFFPDAAVSYPADWDNNPATYAGFLTTSTRLSGSVPNSCGTSGGAKSWYDHMFLSSPIINGTEGIKYIAHSYKTIGNDGNRTGISVNDLPANTSAPAAVINALFQMSNKYPVMTELLVGLPVSSASTINKGNDHVVLTNPVGKNLHLHFDPQQMHQQAGITCMDMTGRVVTQQAMDITTTDVEMPCILLPGLYNMRIIIDGMPVLQTIFSKE